MVAVALFLAAARQGGISAQDALVIILVVFFFLFLFGRQRRRSRYIPVKSKRLAQAKLFEKHYSNRETAKKPLRIRDYEYDHRRSFADGGSAEPENIELITRKENRRKGRKSR
jgi:hypothetical protein